MISEGGEAGPKLAANYTTGQDRTAATVKGCFSLIFGQQE